MATEKTRENDETPFDLFKENKWLFLIVGFAPIRNMEYLLYIGFLVAMQLFVQAMAFYAMYLLTSHKSLIFDALHVVMAACFGVWGIGIRFFANSGILKTVERIKTGVYHYEEEELDAEQIKMKGAIQEEIRWKCNAIVYMYILGFTSNALFLPLSQYFLYDENTSYHPDFLNPYVSHVFYIPFNSRTIIGYIAAYFIDSFFWLVVYVISVSLNRLYITCNVYVKVHLKMLNHSIKNIQRRAYLLYLRNKNVNAGRISEQDLLRSQDFQDCLYCCLKANIKHHQTLLRFRDDCSALVGSILFEVMIIVAIIYASTLYQMYQKLPVNILLNYIFTSMAEQTYTYFLCTFGEELIEESGNVYLNLYGIDWYHYDEKFKQTLGIMMVNSRKPIDFRALILNVPASMETYGDSLSVMYKIMNLARQSDALH